VSVWVGDYASHAHLRGALDQAVGDETICISNGSERSSNGKDTIVNARNDLANASTDTSLVAKISDVLAGLANNHTGLLGGDDGTQSELSLVVLFLSARVVISVDSAELLGEVVNVAVDRRRLDVLGRHCEVSGLE
jgi:hypothetical protein